MPNPEKPPSPKGTTGRTHAIYLAVIALLIIVMVVVVGKALRAQRILNDFEERFNLRSEVRSSLPRSEPLRNVTEAQLLAPRTFDQYRREVDMLIERALELKEFGQQSTLTDACTHALRGGKRLRSIIVLEVGRATTVAQRKKGGLAAAGFRRAVDPADIALFIEYLHTASLVIDDLPIFDDDSERRGKPSVHVKTTAAIAHMASLSLIAAAYQDVCRQIDWIRDNCPEFANVDRMGMRLFHDISQAIGATGAAGGQFMDSSLDPSQLFEKHGNDAVLEIMRLKTATFFELSFLGGWLSAGGSSEEADDVKRAGSLFGTAFQVADDIGDMVQDAARRESGKPGWNYANEYGEEAARTLVTKYLAECESILTKKDLFTPLWEEIYEKVGGMTEQPAEQPAKKQAATLAKNLAAPVAVGPGEE
jgi:geranylgeranyl diphosphate synthase type II